MFGLRSCRRLPRRACLRAHIGSCSAPCTGEISEDDYRERIRRAEAVLKGISPTYQDAPGEMAACAEREETNRHRSATRSRPSRLRERQNVERQKTYDEDIINYIVSDGTVSLMLFNVYRGTLAGKCEYLLMPRRGS